MLLLKLMLVLLIFIFDIVVNIFVCVHVGDLDFDVIVDGLVVDRFDVLGFDCGVIDILDGVGVDVNVVVFCLVHDVVVNCVVDVGRVGVGVDVYGVDVVVVDVNVVDAVGVGVGADVICCLRYL